MPLKTHPDEQPALNLTPMIDIVFLLIIFFMVGTKFAEWESKLTLKVPQVKQTGVWRRHLRSESSMSTGTAESRWTAISCRSRSSRAGSVRCGSSTVVWVSWCGETPRVRSRM